MAKTYPSRAPKRRIEKSESQINQVITNAVTATTLHTCEDRKTLVRSIIQLVASPLATGDYTIALYRLPSGVSMGNPVVAQALDSSGVKEVLWVYSGTHSAPAAIHNDYIEVDLKSMRKLDPADLIVMKTIGSAANSHVLVGYISLFFKE